MAAGDTSTNLTLDSFLGVADDQLARCCPPFLNIHSSASKPPLLFPSLIRHSSLGSPIDRRLSLSITQPGVSNCPLSTQSLSLPCRTPGPPPRLSYHDNRCKPGLCLRSSGT